MSPWRLQLNKAQATAHDGPESVSFVACCASATPSMDAPPKSGVVCGCARVCRAFARPRAAAPPHLGRPVRGTMPRRWMTQVCPAQKLCSGTPARKCKGQESDWRNRVRAVQEHAPRWRTALPDAPVRRLRARRTRLIPPSAAHARRAQHCAQTRRGVRRSSRRTLGHTGRRYHAGRDRRPGARLVNTRREEGTMCALESLSEPLGACPRGVGPPPRRGG